MNFANIITLTTDFGLEDPYVGQMKGAILKRNGSVRIVDLTHTIPCHDIVHAALVIQASYKYFPEGTTHLIVVDPGVGTQRSILAATSGNHLFVAPDNGLLSLLHRYKGIDTCYRVSNEALFPDEISSTFHGRDIMAPVAAALAGGLPLSQLGPATDFSTCVQLDIAEPVMRDDRISGEVLHIDRFGNIKTSITTRHLSNLQPSDFRGVLLNGHRIEALSTTYGTQAPGQLVALIDSSGHLEIAANRDNAATITKACRGDEVTVLFNGDTPL